MKIRGHNSPKLVENIISVNMKAVLRKKHSTNNRPVFVTKVIKTIRHHCNRTPPWEKFSIIAFKKNKKPKKLPCICKNKPENSSTTIMLNIKLNVKHHPIVDTPTASPMHQPKNLISFCTSEAAFYTNISLRIQSSITKRSFRVRGCID